MNMKRILYIGCAALLLASCSKVAVTVEEPLPQEPLPENPPEVVEPVKDVFHATFAQDGTKTMLSEDLEFLWNEDDEISLFRASTYNREYVFDGMDESEAGDFYEINSPEERQVMFSEKPMDRNYAVYPYMSSKHIALSSSAVLTIDLPTVQTYRENSVGPGANVMTAVTEDTDTRNLVFKNTSGYLKINLYGEGVVLRSVTLTSNGGEKLSGKAEIPLEYGVMPVIEMQNSKTYDYVTLSSEEGIELGATKETATAFWFVVPPVTFSSGFTLSATGFYGGDFTKSAPMNFSVERNKYYNIAPLQVTLSGGSMGVGISGWENSASYSGTTD